MSLFLSRFWKIYAVFLVPPPRGMTKQEWEDLLAPTGMGKYSFVILQMMCVLPMMVVGSVLPANPLLKFFGLALGWGVGALIASVLSFVVKVPA